MSHAETVSQPPSGAGCPTHSDYFALAAEALDPQGPQSGKRYAVTRRGAPAVAAFAKIA